MCNYYLRFIDGYATLAAHLYKMVRPKNEKLTWSTEAENAFNAIKDKLCNLPPLRHFDQNRTVYLITDTSDTAVGFTLNQLYEDENNPEIKVMHPISFYSRTLKKYQKNYIITEKEYLGIIYATKLFRNYLLSKEFVVISDHKPLQRAKHFRENVSKRLLRMDMELFEFEFKVEHVPGKHQI